MRCVLYMLVAFAVRHSLSRRHLRPGPRHTHDHTRNPDLAAPPTVRPSLLGGATARTAALYTLRMIAIAIHIPVAGIIAVHACTPPRHSC